LGPCFFGIKNGINRQKVQVPEGERQGGREFLCPLDALKSINEATEEELAECVEGAVVERYSGDIKLVK
jgi:hypothetical protein